MLCLALALATGLIYSQSEALSPAHQHHSGSDQCTICHAGHMPVVPVPAQAGPARPAVVIACWSPSASTSADTPALLPSDPRAPPALILSVA